MTDDKITVKRVGKPEARVVRNLLKFPLRHFGVPRALWLAYLESRELPIGAACGWIVEKEGRCMIRVEEKHRGKGVGRALLGEIVSEAKKAGLKSLRPAHLIGQDDRGFVTQSGFSVEFTLDMYKTTVTATLELSEPLMKRLQKRNKIPASAEIIDLNELNERKLSKEAAQLILRNLGGRPRHVLARVTGKMTGFDHDYSLAVLLDGKPIGILTSNYVKRRQMRVFPSVVVNPKYRTGWANLWLRHTWCEKAREGGLEEDLYFEVREKYADTLKYVKRLNAEKVGARSAYVMNLQ